jgi:hypothetical protein
MPSFNRQSMGINVDLHQHFSAFMKKAITVFVVELEKDPDLRPENFIITRTARKDTADKKRE